MRGSLRQPSLEFWALFFETHQNLVCRGYGERMPHKGASKECHVGDRFGVVVVTPGAAVECVHVFRFSGECSNGHSSAQNFSVGGHVCPNVKPFLRAARCRSEPGDDLIHHHGDVVFLRDASDLVQKLLRLDERVRALDRFYQDRSDLVRVFRNAL